MGVELSMILRRMIVMALAGAIVLAACGEPTGDEAGQVRGDEEHPLLEGLDDPPVNDPLVIPAPVEGGEARLALPDDDLQALLVLLDGEPFAGVIESETSVEVGGDVIRAATEEGALDVLYRLPPRLEPLPQLGGEGRVAVAELSGPAGADRLVEVAVEDRLVFAEVWRTSTEPLEVDLWAGLRLTQRRPEGIGPEYTEAPLELSLFGEVPIGEPVVVESETGPVQVFVEFSHAYEDPYEPERVVYILHVWIAALP